MKRLLTTIFALSLIVGICIPSAAYAASNSQALCEGSGGTWALNPDSPTGGVCSSPDGRTVPGTIQQVADVMIFLIGGIAIIMIIIGGMRYVLSAGDQAALTSAKNTILYSVIGIIVAVMAYALVRFIYLVFDIK